MEQKPTLVRRSSGWGVVLVTLLGACGAVEDMPSQSEDVAAVVELDNEVHAAVEAQDIERVMQFWAPDAVIMAPNIPIVEGHAGVRAFFENAFASMALEFQRSTDEVVVSGDLAIHRGHTVARYTPTGKSTIEDPQKWVDIYRRQEDGRWLISLTVWNSDLPANVAVFAGEDE